MGNIEINSSWNNNNSWEIPVKKIHTFNTTPIEEEFFDKSTDRLVYFLIWFSIFLIAFFVWRFTTHNPSLDEQRSYILYSNGSLLKSLLNQEKTLENQMYNLNTRIIKLQKCIELNNSSGSLNINNCEIWIN